MDKKVIELAREAGMTWASGLNGSGYHINHPNDLERFYEQAFIAGMQEQMRRSVDRAVNAQADAAFRERLAQAIEQMPFGDTATSFATFVRNFE